MQKLPFILMINSIQTKNLLAIFLRDSCQSIAIAWVIFMEKYIDRFNKYYFKNETLAETSDNTRKRKFHLSL